MMQNVITCLAYVTGNVIPTLSDKRIIGHSLYWKLQIKTFSNVVSERWRILLDFINISFLILLWFIKIFLEIHLNIIDLCWFKFWVGSRHGITILVVFFIYSYPEFHFSTTTGFKLILHRFTFEMLKCSIK